MKCSYLNIIKCPNREEENYKCLLRNPWACPFTDDRTNNKVMERARLTMKQLKRHWEWVDDGDGYNQRQEFDIKSLLDAQLAKAFPIFIKEGKRQEKERTIDRLVVVRTTCTKAEGDIITGIIQTLKSELEEEQE